MFNSLLNTIPVISGNFTIACRLNDINKKSKTNFYVYINSAEIKPNDVNSSMYKPLNLNLANGKYAFDVKRYKDNCDIYKDNYSYSKTVFRTFDRYNVMNDRNKTFEFGCQRISHKLNGYEWSFYAPIYINKVEDLPDYFVIEIKNKTNGRLLKKIKVAIGKRYNTNKLYHYLKRHIESIENNVPITWHYNNNEIILNNAIDSNNGALTTRVIKSGSQMLYDNHVTINEFDSMLSYLYYNTSCLMAEIIPLSFEFNLDDFITESEKYYFEFNAYDISGYYEKNELMCNFFAFDANSHSSSIEFEIFDSKSNSYIKKSSDVYNIRNINSLHEGTNIYLTNTNTLSKTYCKWCNYDDNNYIINNNVSYSLLMADYINRHKYGLEQTDTTEQLEDAIYISKYGKYPIFKSNMPSIKLRINAINKSINAILPIGDNANETTLSATDEKYTSDEIVIYNNLMNNNVTTWFRLFNGNNSFNDYKNWPKVNKYNQSSFCNGILYHNLPEDADYFNVFVRNIDIDTSTINKANLIYDAYSVNTDKYNNVYDLYNNNRLYITTNEYLSKIDTNAEKLIAEKDYYVYDSTVNDEIYIEYSDNFEIYKSIISIVDDSYLYINSFNYKNFKDIISLTNEETGAQEIRQYIVDNYDAIYYLNDITNTYSQIKYLLSDPTLKDKQDNTNISIFRKTTFAYVMTGNQIYDKISDLILNNVEIKDKEYIATIDTENKTIAAITNNIRLIENYKTQTMDDFEREALDMLKSYFSLYMELYLNANSNIYIDKLVKYYYHIGNNISAAISTGYFIEYSNNNVYDIYVDSCKLNDLINSFNYKRDTYNTETGKYTYKEIGNINIDRYNIVKEKKYCKFLNLDHVHEYFDKLYFGLNDTDIPENIFNTIYVRVKYIDEQFNIKYYVYKLNDYIKEQCGIENPDPKYFLNNIYYFSDINMFKCDFKSYYLTLDDNDDITSFGINNSEESPYIELFFEKEMYKLNETLYNILNERYACRKDIDGEIKLISNYPISCYCLYYMIRKNEESNTYYLDEAPDKESVDFLKFIYPMFSTVYISEKFLNENSLMLSNIKQNNYKYQSINNSINIYKKISYEDALDYIDNGIVVYKYAHINYAVLDEFEQNGETEYIHKTTVTDKYGNSFVLSYLLINNYMSMNTLSYNIFNDIYDNVNLDLIDEKTININNEEQFKLIYPFLKNDIFLDVIYSLRKWISLPANIRLLLKYKWTYVGDNGSTQIVENPLKQYVYLNRYFGNIMPLFVSVKSVIPDMYKEIFKKDGINFTNTQQYPIYEKFPCNIYNGTGIYYIDDYSDLNPSTYNHKELQIIENKHFNNNILYHLPREIIIPVNEPISYGDIENYEKEEKIKEYFSNYVKNNYFNSVDNESLLFLFNRYSYICEKNVVKYNLRLKVRMYNIVYKFKLK